MEGRYEDAVKARKKEDAPADDDDKAPGRHRSSRSDSIGPRSRDGENDNFEIIAGVCRLSFEGFESFPEARKPVGNRLERYDGMVSSLIRR